MAVSILFNAVNVNGQYTNAAVSIGENAQSGWSAHSKNNFGIGPLFGINPILSPFTWILDPDAIDSPIIDPDIIPNFQNQQV